MDACIFWSLVCVHAYMYITYIPKSNPLPCFSCAYWRVFLALSSLFYFYLFVFFLYSFTQVERRPWSGSTRLIVRKRLNGLLLTLCLSHCNISMGIVLLKSDARIRHVERASRYRVKMFSSYVIAPSLLDPRLFWGAFHIVLLFSLIPITRKHTKSYNETSTPSRQKYFLRRYWLKRCHEVCTREDSHQVRVPHRFTRTHKFTFPPFDFIFFLLLRACCWHLCM